MSQRDGFNDHDQEGSEQGFPADGFGHPPAPGQGGFQDAFGPAQPSNPFSADLKGDFSSGFGGGGGLSQIFKEGGLRENRSKIIVGLFVVLGAIAGAYLYFTDPEHMSDDYLIVEDDSRTKKNKKDSKAPEHKEDEHKDAREELAKDDALIKKPSDGKALVNLDPKPAKVVAAAPILPHSLPAFTKNEQQDKSVNEFIGSRPSLSEPVDGASRVYDETSTDATFTWTGSGGGWILFSRNAQMSPVDFRMRVRGNRFTYRKSTPGTWYWQVRNRAGASDVRSFRVEPPVKRQIVLAAPGEGATLAGSGGHINWTGDHRVAYYRVELGHPAASWANPMYRFATSGTQLQLQSVAAGAYQLRLGAFSEVSGRWEYTSPINVTVQ